MMMNKYRYLYLISKNSIKIGRIPHATGLDIAQKTDEKNHGNQVYFVISGMMTQQRCFSVLKMKAFYETSSSSQKSNPHSSQ